MFCDIDSNYFTIQDSFLMVRIYPSPGGTLVQRCINPRVNSTRRISFFVGEIASVGRAQKQESCEVVLAAAIYVVGGSNPPLTLLKFVDLGWLLA